MTWQSGVQIILFLAALQSIPPSLKEAASVEGATALGIFLGNHSSYDKPHDIGKHCFYRN